MVSKSAYNESGFNIGFASRPSKNKKHNADNYTVFDTRSFAEPGMPGEVSVQVAIVADGCGRVRGQIASHLAIQTIYELVINNPSMPIMQRLLTGMNQANSAILRQAMLDPGLEGMSAMVLAVAIVGDILMVAHIGNSRAYVVRNGVAHCLTIDQIPKVNNSSMQLTDTQGAPVQNILPPRLGVEESPQIDVSIVDFVQRPTDQQVLWHMPRVDYIRLQSNDTILICTDGLSDAIPSEQIAVAIGQFAPRDAANYLADLARQTNGSDDTSVVVLQRVARVNSALNAPTSISRLSTLTIPATFYQKRRLPRPALWGMASLVLVALAWFAITGLTGRAESDGGTASATPTTAAVAQAETAVVPPAATASAENGEAAASAAGEATENFTAADLLTQTPTTTATPKATSTTAPTETPITETPIIETSIIETPTVTATAVVSEELSVSIGGDTAAALETITATSEAVTATLISTPVSETPTSTAEVTVPVTPTIAMVDTATPLPTDTVAPITTDTPTTAPTKAPPSPTRVPPTATPTSAPVAFWAGQYVNLLSPPEEENVMNRGSFTWEPLPFSLPDGYAYEIVFWPRGGDAMANGQGWAGVTLNASVDVNFSGVGAQPGQYNWGILLVQTKPEYKRLAQLSAKRIVNINRSE